MAGIIVVIDGPRGSGKTSTAQSLVNFLENNGVTAHYHKKGKRSEENEFINIVAHLVDFRQMRAEVVVVDRFLVTELAMSFAHDRVKVVDLVKWSMMCSDLFKEFNVFQYTLLPSLETLKIRLAKRRNPNVSSLEEAELILSKDESDYDSRSFDMDPKLLIDTWDLSSKMAESKILDSEKMSQDEIIQLIYNELEGKDETAAESIS